MKYFILYMAFMYVDHRLNAQSMDFTYDSHDRLTQVIYPDSSIIYYSYDAAGNRLTKAVSQSTITFACPEDIVTFYAGVSDTTKTYQWQTDTATGFIDILPSPLFSGVDSSTLTLNNPPTNFYGHKYRCVISDTIGQAFSPIFTLKFEVSWIGEEDIAWENSANWGCGSVPDENTDVVIRATAPRFPEVNSIAYCRKIFLQYGASVLIKSGFQLNTTGGGD